MNSSGEHRERVARLLGEIAVEEGMNRTSIDGVEVYRATASVPRAPIVYLPRIIIVGQGRKCAYLGGQTYHYDAFNYLVLSVPLPAECETEASPEEPLFLLAIHVEPAMVGEMMLELDETTEVGPTPRGISSTPMNEEMAGAVIRLLECLKKPSDRRVLGRQMVREIVYRVLQGQQGGALRALTSRDDHFARIARVLRQVHAEYATPFSVEELARKAGMSLATFHHYFKIVTSCSPLQYLKRIRLDHAKRLMTLEGYPASAAAKAVGYESPSQFSREFKRLYGQTPAKDALETRTRLVNG